MKANTSPLIATGLLLLANLNSLSFGHAHPATESASVENATISSEEQIWEKIRERGLRPYEAGEGGDVLGASIPFVDAFIGPLADKMENVEISPRRDGNLIEINLIGAQHFSVDRKNRTSRGGILGIDVADKVTMILQNHEFRVSFKKISGIQVKVEVPTITFKWGQKSFDVKQIDIDVRKQKLNFTLGKGSYPLKIPASVDLSNNRFVGVDMFKAILQSGPAIVGLF